MKRKQETITVVKADLEKALWKVLGLGVLIGGITVGGICGGILVKTGVLEVPTTKIEQEEPCYPVACLPDECYDSFHRPMSIQSGKSYHCGLHGHDCEYGR